MFDVVIIGAGVTGSAIAREVSRYKLNTCVIEKEEDVCNDCLLYTSPSPRDCS